MYRAEGTSKIIIIDEAFNIVGKAPTIKVIGATQSTTSSIMSSPVVEK